MFHKFVLAFKTKTIELFADDDGGTAPEEAVITGQRVVVIKPDQPPGHIKLHKLHAMVRRRLLQGRLPPAPGCPRPARRRRCRVGGPGRCLPSRSPLRPQARPSREATRRPPLPARGGGAREPEPAPHLRHGREPVAVGDRWKRAGEEESRQLA